ncbi:hypothetical protein OAL85_03585 [Methylophilaceae bacterium]|nr:hypothetical protein [Methylophilaceae bacterium]
MSWFSSKEEEEEDASFYKFDTLPEIDSDHLINAGNSDGKMGREVSEGSLPAVINTETESLEKYHVTQYNKAQKWFTQFQNKADLAIADTNISVISVQLKNESVSSEFATRILHSSENKIKSLHSSFLEAKKNYHQFKNEHSLSLLPQNADPKEIKTQYKIFFGIVILELVINIFVLFQGEALSLPSAVVLSVLQVAVNIGSCFFAGIYLFGRVKFAKGMSRIILGTIAILHGYLIFVLNANMGLTRDVIQQKAGIAGILNPGEIAAAWQMNPWPALATLQVESVFVIGLGILFAVIAYVDGTKSDDLYPHYGAVYRKPLALKRLVDDHISQLLDSWAQIEANLNKDISNIASKAKNSIKNWSKECNKVEQVWDDYNEVLKNIDKHHKRIHKFYLSEYNRNNVGNNITIDQPSILSEEDTNLEKLFSDVHDYKFKDTVRLEKTEQMHTKFSKEFKILQKEITEESAKLTNRIKDIAKLFPCEMER